MNSQKRAFNSLFIKVFLITLCISRFFYLDQDVPSYMISGISQEDESYYSIGAVLRYFSDLGLTEPEYNSTAADPVCLYSTPLTYLSFHVFGNNYWGLRFSVPVLSLLVIFLLYKSAKNKLKTNLTSVNFLLFLLVTDFYFFAVSRYQNPQLYSLLVISFCLFCFYNVRDTNKKIFLVTFISVSSVLFIYVYNIFLVFGALFYFTTIGFIKKDFKVLLYLVFGGLASFLVFIITLQIMGFTIFDYVKIFTDFNEKRNAISVEIELGIVNAIFSAVKNASSILFTNLFRYNLIWLLFFIYGIISRIVLILKNGFKLMNTDFLFFIMICAFIQAAFLNSYPFKKWVVLLPVVYCFGIEFFKKFSITDSKMFLIAVFFLVPISLYSYKINNSINYWSGFNYGYYENVPIFISIIPLFTVLIFVVSIIFYFKSHLKSWIYFFCILLNVMISINVFFLNKKFELRDYLLKLKPQLENQYLIDGFPHAYCLYSNAIPILNPYSYNYKKDTYSSLMLSKKDKKKYFLVKEMRDKSQKITYNSNFTLLEKKYFNFYNLILYEYN
tara:strand:- start:70 stop:1737 length:1668 start_codon:yes stop_codon:yes gene_type:complete